MSTSLIFAAFFAAYLWLVVRSFRLGTLTGILTFVFWPVGIFGTVRYWGDADRDIAWPFLATLVAFVGVYYVALPRVAAAAGELESETAAYAEMGARPGTEIAEAQPTDEFSESVRYRQAVGRIGYQTGAVSVPEAHATLDVPRHFRFAPRSYVVPIEEEFGEGAREGLVGWLVHETVDLADDDAWYIEVSWDGRGHYAEGDAASLQPAALLPEMQRITERFSREENDGEVGYSLVGLAHPPYWDSAARVLTWGEEISYAGEPTHLLDCYAAKPGSEGVFHFVAEYMDRKRAELCLRAVRLMAARTRYAEGHDYGDYSRWRHESSGHELVDLVTGKAYLD